MVIFTRIFTLRVRRALPQTLSLCITYIKSLSSTSQGKKIPEHANKIKSTSESNFLIRQLIEAIKMTSKKGDTKVVNPSSLVNCHLQVIGTGNCELSPSLCLFTDSRRYVFNCGENFQRFTREYRMRVLKDPMLFVTRVTWRNLGGLPGFSMSYRDSGRTHLHVYGPGRIVQFVEVMRYFIGREKLKFVTNWEADVSTSTCPSDVMMTSPSTHVYSDENVTITTVELEPKSAVDSRTRDVKVDATSPLDDRREIVTPEPKRIKYDEDHTPLPASTAAFICKLADTRGKFNPDRAKELGLVKGPMYRKLAAGESVTAPDGRVVHPSDVIGEKQVGPTFIVIECPDSEHISTVVSHPKLQKDHFSNLGQELALVVHLSPLEVLQDDDYCHWAASFGESTRHLLLNKSVCPKEVGLRALMKMQYPLYLMNPNVHHPPPTYKNNSERDNLKLSRLFPKSKNAIILGKSFLKFHLKPVRKLGEDHSDVLGPLEDEISERVTEIQSNTKLASAIAAGQAISKPESAKAQNSTNDSLEDIAGARTNPRGAVEKPKSEDLTNKSDSAGHISNPTDAPNMTKDIMSDTEAKPDEEAPVNQVDRRMFEKLCIDPRPLTPFFHSPDDAVVTFLGTGASIPSRYRNVSGILVQTPNSGNFMLDCGEGSLSQIYRCFPREIADEIILNLKAVFISHIHGDHHLGIVNVLQKKEQLLAAKQRGDELMSASTSNRDNTVVIAPVFNIKWMTRYEQLIENIPCKFVNCSTLTRDELQKVQVDDSAGVIDFHFETVPVVHCAEAYGVVVRHTSGWSMVYSGDTRPCPELVKAGKGATLLIHEATLEDGLLELAVVKKHCTVSEALEISDKMNPEFTILTHFSQRYPKIPSFLMADQLHSRVAIAFDCMSVNLKRLDQLHSYLPAMRDIFTEVVDVEGEDFELSHVASSWDFTVSS